MKPNSENLCILKNAKIVNLTPHDVVIMDEYNKVRDVFPRQEDPSKAVRLIDNKEWLMIINDIKVAKNRYTKSSELPDPEPGKFFIVSSRVMEEFPLRKDFLVPNELVRDENGRVIGCRSFQIK